MSTINSVLDFLKNATLATLTQVVGLLGFFFVFGLALYLLERWTNNCFYKTIGWKGVLWTAWIGAPVHESGHALFCLLFRHQIAEIRFFSPDTARPSTPFQLIADRQLLITQYPPHPGPHPHLLLLHPQQIHHKISHRIHGVIVNVVLIGP